MKDLTVTKDEFINRYIETQVNTYEGLSKILSNQKERFQPEGWLLFECQDFSSSHFGEKFILPYGEKCTLKEPPTHPMSLRGLASDMSVVVAILPVSEVE